MRLLASTPAGTAQPPVPAENWRRDATPGQLCSCEHLESSHNISTIAKPCSRCGCRVLTVTALLWREHRTVTESAGVSS